MRFYCKLEEFAPKNNIQKADQEKGVQPYRRPMAQGVQVQYWNEFAQVRREKKKANSIIGSIKETHDLYQVFQNLNNFPCTLTELYYYLRRRRIRNELAEQKYLPQRAAILKPDLAAAHFLLRRGASIKFVGHQNWIGLKEKEFKLPLCYVPGMFLESIKAEGTKLYFEGLKNIEKLFHLQYLSLKNLETINDWCLDWISKEYSASLKHLDISGCKNVTYRGLSCFYRFECLETLEVNGISDSAEFKLGCLMLLDLMPSLDIKGIDLSIPKQIDPVDDEGIPKQIDPVHDEGIPKQIDPVHGEETKQINTS